MNVLKKIFGTKSDRDVKNLQPFVNEINTLYETLSNKSDDELVSRTAALRKEIISAREEAQEQADTKDLAKEEFNKVVHEAEQAKLDELLPEAYAIVKETCINISADIGR